MVYYTKNIQAEEANIGDIAGDAKAYRPAFNVIDFRTSMQTSRQSSELKIMGNNTIASSSQAAADNAAGLNPSWFAIAKSRVDCVLCTVHGFQLQCIRGITGAATESRAKEVYCSNRAAACERCGLRRDWHKASICMRKRADERLQDNELVCVARIIAL